MMMMLLLGQVRFNFFRARQIFGPAAACAPLRTGDTTTLHLPPHLNSSITEPNLSSSMLTMRLSWPMMVLVVFLANRIHALILRLHKDCTVHFCAFAQLHLPWAADYFLASRHFS
jgi:hypothetical protein